jgi:hypothetical protein
MRDSGLMASSINVTIMLVFLVAARKRIVRLGRLGADRGLIRVRGHIAVVC